MGRLRYIQQVPAQNINKKRKNYKIIFKGSIHSFYNFGKKVKEKSLSKIWNISQILTTQDRYSGGLPFII